MTVPKKITKGIQLRLSKAEAVVIYAALRLLAELSDSVPDAIAPKSALLSKLTAKLNAALAEPVLTAGEKLANQVIDGIVPEVHITDLVDSDFSSPMYTVGDRLPDLQAALAASRTVTITYYSLSREAVNQRDVDPYQIVERGPFWLLIGYCHWRAAIRVFRIDRIKTVTRTETTYAVPDGFDAAAFLNGFDD
jgi:predicted DNA-binding transcriptional regulator YafY